MGVVVFFINKSPLPVKSFFYLLGFIYFMRFLRKSLILSRKLEQWNASLPWIKWLIPLGFNIVENIGDTHFNKDKFMIHQKKNGNGKIGAEY